MLSCAFETLLCWASFFCSSLSLSSEFSQCLLITSLSLLDTLMYGFSPAGTPSAAVKKLQTRRMKVTWKKLYWNSLEPSPPCIHKHSASQSCKLEISPLMSMQHWKTRRLLKGYRLEYHFISTITTYEAAIRSEMEGKPSLMLFGLNMDMMIGAMGK